MSFWKNLFNKKDKPIISDKKEYAILSEIKVFDDVFVKINNSIYPGWVTARDGNIVTILCEKPNNEIFETDFTIKRPLNRNYLEDQNKVLYLNEEAIK